GAGEFTVPADTGVRTIVVSALGYRSDTLRLGFPPATFHRFLLEPSAIVLPEVVVTSEDPALTIIRRAIARKHQWIDRLASFTMEAFTRQVLRRDTAIASITEAATRGYWRAGDTLREVVIRRRQTANVNESFNFASVGTILNFNEDRIRFLGYNFVGPTADDALDFYDYKLLRTRSGNGRQTYDIRMIPRTRLTPLFSGTVSIDGDTYALAGVDVEPNEAFSVPFVREHRLRYAQQFALYDSLFWLPADIHIDGRFIIGIPGVTFPPIGFEQTSVISSYAINVPVPDSMFRKPRISVDSSARARDTTFWTSRDVLPLTSEERSAYRTLDSTKTLEVQFRPGGIAATLSAGGGPHLPLSLLDLSFNRVEGFHAGLSGKLDSLSHRFELHGSAAYAFASKYTSATAGGTLFLLPDRMLGVGADWVHRYERTPGWGPYDGFMNALTALFFKNDYYDYYRAEGWRAYLTYRPSASFNTRLVFTSEWEFAAPKATDYSFFHPSQSYRENPAADEGKMRSLRLEARLGREDLPIDFITTNSVGVSLEYASPVITGGDFSFTQYNLFGTLAVPTFGKSFLLRPQLRFRIAAGTTFGRAPRQDYFSVESSSSGAAPFGAMKAMDVKEYEGTRYVALHVEHNFRTLPFLALGIPFLYENNLELIVHGGTANAWGGDVVHHDGWYYEAGLSLNRVLELLRVDGTWRLSRPHGFRVTLGFANVL
ncbi:MAG TPA: DUF5686 family protein, partial [Bacteroidota bacterium]